MHFVQFFPANICNPRTRLAYGGAAAGFLPDNRVPSIEAVQPLHVAA